MGTAANQHNIAATNSRYANATARLELTFVLDCSVRLGPGKAVFLESVRATRSPATAPPWPQFGRELDGNVGPHLQHLIARLKVEQADHAASERCIHARQDNAAQLAEHTLL
jgi:hypothetical protein